MCERNKLEQKESGRVRKEEDESKQGRRQSGSFQKLGQGQSYRRADPLKRDARENRENDPKLLTVVNDLQRSAGDLEGNRENDMTEHVSARSNIFFFGTSVLPLVG